MRRCDRNRSAPNWAMWRNCLQTVFQKSQQRRRRSAYDPQSRFFNTDASGASPLPSKKLSEGELRAIGLLCMRALTEIRCPGQLKWTNASSVSFAAQGATARANECSLSLVSTPAFIGADSSTMLELMLEARSLPGANGDVHCPTRNRENSATQARTLAVERALEAFVDIASTFIASRPNGCSCCCRVDA
jgi:hypothetical protein